MNPTDLLATVLAFLDDQQWATEVSESGIVHTRYDGDSIDIDCFIQPLEDEAQLIVTCVVGVGEPDRLRDLAELASRVNFLLRVGSFEVDFDDGELRNRVGIPLPQSGADVDLVGTAIYHGVLATDRYAPAFLAVATGSATPEEAIETLRDTALLAAEGTE